MKRNEPFTTTDSTLAAFLHANGMEILGAIPSKDEKRLQIVFFDSDVRESLVENFNIGEDRVSAQVFHRSLKMVMRHVHDPKLK